MLRQIRNPMPIPQAPPAPARPQVPPVLSEEDLSKLRDSAGDADPEVRWTAIEALYELRDPQAPVILRKALGSDSDPELRAKAASLLKNKADPSAISNLAAGLKDPDKDVRIAALAALGAIGDPIAAARVAESLKDPDPEVRMEAIRTLERFQEKHAARYSALKEELRRDYEGAVQKSKNGEDYGTGNQRDQ